MSHIISTLDPRVPVLLITQIRSWRVAAQDPGPLWRMGTTSDAGLPEARDWALTPNVAPR